MSRDQGWEERTIWDCRHHQWVVASVLALPVYHPDYPDQPLWLVIARRKGGLPWYLLTNEPVTCAEDACRIMFAYALADRIGVEGEQKRVGRSSVRVCGDLEPREKLLLLATLAYGFLLTLLAPFYEPLRRWLLRQYSHRTGWHNRLAYAPFARLRMALSRLWHTFPAHWERLSGRSQPVISMTLA